MINFCYGLKDGDDLYSSVTALEGVFNVEKYLIGNLENYITGSKEKINGIKSILTDLREDYRKLVKHYSLSGTNFNTIHIFFSLVRKLRLNLPSLKNNLSESIAETINNFTNIATTYDLPTSKDLDGVTLAILRIQEVYNIKAEEIANGFINGINFGKKFTASDCLIVAYKLRELDHHYYAIEWYEIVLKRIKEEGWKGIDPEMNEIMILDLLAYSQYKEGSFNNSIAAIKTILYALNISNFNIESVILATNLITFIQHHIDLKLKVKQPGTLEIPHGTMRQYNLTVLDLLKKGCRGELKKSSKEERHLFCKYENKNHPYLIFAPIKMEILNLSPYLAVFHDVIYDSEIEILKELSRDKLVRATVWNAIKGVGEASFVRTSKYAWFENETHPVMHILNQRISDMTGFAMETSENFQLMNYGSGGHYDIHPDYFTEPKDNKDVQPYPFYNWGNRIATVLFYMSDVQHGGSTVWPNINVMTKPKKGTAAFWYNIFLDGNPDYRSQHSACPIISGSKWVINKWIRINGQIFRKPCLPINF